MNTLTRTIAAATMLAGGLLASTAYATDLRVTVWVSAKEQLDMLNGFAAGFKKTHPDVNVTFESIPAANYTQKLTLEIAGGNTPDLGWIMEDSAPTFEQAGVLMDLAPTLKNTPDYDFADFSAPAMGLWQNNGKVYAIPFSTSPFLIYYNKTLFDQARVEDPEQLAAKGEWTMDKFREVAKAIKDATGVYGFEFKDGQGYESRVMHAIMPPIRAYGGDAWVNGQCGLDTDQAVAAMTVLHDMVFKDKSIVPPGDQSDFFAGAAAMTINQISRVPTLKTANFKWGLAPLPTGPAGAAPIIGQAAIAVFASGKNAQIAADFAAYMTNKQNVATMAKFFPPARKSVLADKAFLTSNPAISAAQMQYVADGIANGKVLPSNVKSPQILAAMAPKIDAFWKADADPKQAMQAVCSVVKPLL
ncbi:MAG TPA: sugar ABC transporter substrate-binding protein [Devosia sp.]|nr:sugar ABC transporter substrate-binding protein [Devosia sp.]